ncbi:MAG: aminotransferase class I/II-fold pyridoxal phosphate-dependent enzyme [Bacteroidota bacterium]|nr:aminotransferase class I/II-fold pyridoxal phosphate-dependent enzyme [Bacteroidota bacterium]
MTTEEFKKQAHQFVDWMAEYFETVEKFPVKAKVNPGEILEKLPLNPPAEAESMDEIFHDFRQTILPGMTHWQSPNFFAYFPANSSYPSVLAEMLTATLGAQCMIWETSPAAAELEERVMNWLIQMMGLPQEFEGVIQDTASTATLTALLTAREKASEFQINENGFKGNEKFRIYCSTETHSSVEKAVKIAGFGRNSLVKIDVDEDFKIKPGLLQEAINRDIEQGFRPLCIITTIGTTSTTAIDPLEEIVQISSKYKIWLHVDAALAGSALILPEFRWMINGIDKVDSFVFNPHKWLFTNFDCSAYFVRDAELLIKTLEILPEYLKTQSRGKVNDYRDWGVPLGRRFRALKLWFVIRNFGLKGLQEKLRHHLQLSQQLKENIIKSDDFEIMAPVPLNTICFRYHPSGINDTTELNKMNEALMHQLNESGKVYFTHTRLNGNYVIRFVIGQTNVTEKHIKNAWEMIKETAKRP